jgi:hypothetical protein
MRMDPPRSFSEEYRSELTFQSGACDSLISGIVCHFRTSFLLTEETLKAVSPELTLYFAGDDRYPEQFQSSVLCFF